MDSRLSMGVLVAPHACRGNYQVRPKLDYCLFLVPVPSLIIFSLPQQVHTFMYTVVMYILKSRLSLVSCHSRSSVRCQFLVSCDQPPPLVTFQGPNLRMPEFLLEGFPHP